VYPRGQNTQNHMYRNTRVDRSGLKLTSTLLFLDDVQLLGLQGVQGAGGVGIQGVKSPNTTCTCSLHNCQESPLAAGVKVP
jgi:hypothetical protein